MALLVLPLLATAQAPSGGVPAGLPENPQDLVRQVVANELAPRPRPLLTYRYTRVRPDRKEVRQMVETEQILLGRIVSVNGSPLTAEQTAQEDLRLQRLVNDPEELRAKQKEQAEETERIRKVIRALPDGFLYQYGGVHSGKEGEFVVLNFRPNPNFNPPSRETQAFHGMAGSMQISLPARRLTRLEANLIQDVSFGWGILGKLHEGGEFLIEQIPVEGGRWMIRRMVLNFTGRVLLFKTLKINQEQFTSDYQPVLGMSVPQGIDFLKRADSQSAAAFGARK
ncbi:MAG: hypothetical protein AB7O65_07230 [Candidatus Korobacteraceae bacterium]